MSEITKKDVIIPNRKEKSEWKQNLYNTLLFLGTEREDLFPRKKDSFNTLLESFLFWVDEYNDGYCSEWDEADKDKYCAYLLQEYRRLYDPEEFQKNYEEHTFEESLTLAKDAVAAIGTERVTVDTSACSGYFVARSFKYMDGADEVELELVFEVVKYKSDKGHFYYGVYSIPEVIGGIDITSEPEWDYTNSLQINELAKVIDSLCRTYTKEYLWELYLESGQNKDVKSLLDIIEKKLPKKYSVEEKGSMSLTVKDGNDHKFQICISEEE